jgi:hypothetical protein
VEQLVWEAKELSSLLEGGKLTTDILDKYIE